MPRRSSSPSLPKRKITTVPDNRNLPAIVSQKPSFLQTMKDGVALGIGSSIGHRVVGAFMGPPTVQAPIVEKTNIEYEKCMKEYDDKIACEIYNK